MKIERESSKAATIEREIKITPVREMSKDKRDPREKSAIKEEKRELAKEKDKEKRKEKRASSAVEFEGGDLSSVSNSSTSSTQPNTDVMIVDEPRGNFKTLTQFISAIFS